MSTTTNANSRQKRFTLADMSSVMMDRKNVPVGFFISRALWIGLNNRLQKEGLGSNPTALNGVKIAIDPSLPDNEFDVAFTEDAWSKRLSAVTLHERQP